MNATVTTAEFAIDLEENAEGLGAVIITDAALLIRPAVAGQYHRNSQHDTARAHRILNLGNDMGRYPWHIYTALGFDDARRLLDRVISNYVEACCFDQGCDANVSYYYASNGDVLVVDDYGWDDGNYTMRFYVYYGVINNDPEALVQELVEEYLPGDRIVLVTPDTSDDGYSLRGLVVEDSGEDGSDVHHDIAVTHRPRFSGADRNGGYLSSSDREPPRSEKSFGFTEVEDDSQDDGCPHCGLHTCNTWDCQQ